MVVIAQVQMLRPEPVVGLVAAEWKERRGYQASHTPTSDGENQGAARRSLIRDCHPRNDCQDDEAERPQYGRDKTPSGMFGGIPSPAVRPGRDPNRQCGGRGGDHEAERWWSPFVVGVARDHGVHQVLIASSR
jgi:hypothetical protein